MELNTSTTGNSPLSTNSIGFAFLGILVGCLVAYIGVAFALTAFGPSHAVYGVGFIAFCVGAAFEWWRLGAIRFASVSAGYLCSLGVTLGIRLKAPMFILPLIIGLALFALGIIIRQYVTNSKKSPSS